MSEKLKPIYFTPALPHKFPLWHAENFDSSIINRTHMYGPVKDHIKRCLDLIREILILPDDRQIFFVPGSCSGAMLCAFLNFLNGENAIVYRSGYFSEQFSVDIERLVRNVLFVDFFADKMPYQTQRTDRFLVYTETTKGLMYDNFDFLPDTQETSGVTIVDAASALFLEKMPWEKFDVVAGCCQKVLGGDGSLGFLIVNQKALDRIGRYNRYIPRLFDIARWGLDTLYGGQIMSTPSVMAFVDLLPSLLWVQQNGGVRFLKQRATENFAVIEQFLKNTDKFTNVVKNPNQQSSAVVNLDLAEWHTDSNEERVKFVAEIAAAAEKALLYDISNFAAPNWRFWIGPTQEASDIEIGLQRFLQLF